MASARHILVATQHGNAPRLVAGYKPDVVVTAVTDRIRAARRMNLLPGVKSVIVEENERGSQTMQNAITQLAAEGSIKPGKGLLQSLDHHKQCEERPAQLDCIVWSRMELFLVRVIVS